MHCNGKIGNLSAKIIIDSGAVSNIVSNNSLKKIDWKIQRPSNINLVGINEHKARPLGEVIDLPITIGSENLKINALVTEKGDYDLILGNNWMHNNKAIVDWKDGSLQFENNNNIVSTSITCLERRNNESQIDQFMAIEDNVEIKIFDNNGKGIIPEKAHENDAGFDFKYPEEKPLVIQPHEIVKIDFHIAIEIQNGNYC